MKKIIKTTVDWITGPFVRYKMRRRMKQRLAEIKKHDPFIYD